MMKGLFSVILLLLVATPLYAVGSSFNVVDYGAKGDGETDDSQAFLKAWQNVCGATQDAPTLLIPNGMTFRLLPVSFQGPCKSTTVSVELEGTLVAPKSVGDWKWSNNNKEAWLRFISINGLVIQGGGTLDGQGAVWWNKYSVSTRPTTLQFQNCKNVALTKVTHVNSPRNHISIASSSGFSVSNIHIVAPVQSPNTDGIDISSSSNILIENSVMETGDDCIAVNKGSTFINITGITCGPGHGISVGSLGRGGQYETVEEVHVRNCTFLGTQNGARIKTWQGGAGYARKITYEDIILLGVKNPLIINQNYHEAYEPSGSQNGAVKVSDVTFRKFTGTSASVAAITLNCDPSVGCTNIELDDIDITFAGGGKNTIATCSYVKGTFNNCIPQVHCVP